MGHVVVDGIRLPIDSMALHGGKLVLTCAVRGPLPARQGGAVTVFGDDGGGVAQGYSNVSWAEVGPSQVLSCEITMGFESCHGDAETVMK